MARRFATVGAVAALVVIAASLSWVGELAAAPGRVAAQPGATTKVAVRGASATVERDVPYAPDDPKRLLDVWMPATPAEGRPVLVLVHGGGWGGGSRADMENEAQDAASQGWTVFNIDYPTTDTLGLDGQAWPVERDAVVQALAWVHSHAAERGGDPTKVAALGASAGGNLVALAVAGGSTDVVATALWSAPADLVGLVAVDDQPPPDCDGQANCVEFWSAPWVENFLGCLPAQCPATYAAASPVNQVGARTPPTWVANATSEIVPFDQAKRLVAQLELAKVPTTLHTVDGKDHANAYANEVWNDMMPWLAGQLGVPAPEPIDFSTPPDLVLPAVAITAALLIVLALWWGRRARAHR